MLWSRFGKETVFKHYKQAAKDNSIDNSTMAQYMKLIKLGGSIVPRKKPTKGESNAKI